MTNARLISIADIRNLSAQAGLRNIVGDLLMRLSARIGATLRCFPRYRILASLVELTVAMPLHAEAVLRGCREAEPRIMRPSPICHACSH